MPATPLFPQKTSEGRTSASTAKRSAEPAHPITTTVAVSNTSPSPKKSAAASAKSTVTATGVSPARSQRRRQRVAPALSVADRLKLQRLQLLHLARHGASVAAALLTSSEFSPSASSTVSLTAAASTAVSTARRGQNALSNATFAKGRGAVHGAGVAGNERSENVAQNTLFAASARTASAAERTKTTKRNVGGVDSQDETSRLDEGDEAVVTSSDPPQNTTSAVEAVPCSYAELWRGLLQLQFIRAEEEKEKDNDAQNRVPLSGGTTQRQTLTRTAEMPRRDAPPVNSALRPGRSLTSLADDLAALGDDWRDFFLNGADPLPTSSPRHTYHPSVLGQGGWTAAGVANDFACSTVATPGELYTLRRYATHQGVTSADRNEDSAGGNDAVTTGVSCAAAALRRYLLTSENADSMFVMDFL